MPRGRSNKVGGRPADQQNAIDRLERGKQPPGWNRGDVSISQSGECDGREIERGFTITDHSHQTVGDSPSPDLDRMEEEEAENGGHYGYRLSKAMPVKPKPVHDQTQPACQKNQTECVDHHRSGNHQSASKKIFKYHGALALHRKLVKNQNWQRAAIENALRETA